MPDEGDHEREVFPDAMEDREDYLLGITVLELAEPTITLEELERRLGVEI